MALIGPAFKNVGKGPANQGPAPTLPEIRELAVGGVVAQAKLQVAPSGQQLRGQPQGLRTAAAQIAQFLQDFALAAA